MRPLRRGGGGRRFRRGLTDRDRDGGVVGHAGTDAETLVRDRVHLTRRTRRRVGRAYLHLKVGNIKFVCRLGLRLTEHTRYLDLAVSRRSGERDLIAGIDEGPRRGF